MRYLINKIVISKKQNKYHLWKNAFLNILSWANELHKSKSTYLKSLEHGENYFFEHQVPEFITLGLKHLIKAIVTYKKIIRKDIVDVKDRIAAMLDDINANKTVDYFFIQTQEDCAVTSEFYNK